MKHVLAQEKLRPDALESVEGLSGQDVRECYQCGKCTAGCPIAADMDLPPNQVIRLLQLGLADEALRSRTIWLCASCETCTTRCPREVDLAAVMDALRNLALREGVRPTVWAVAFFNRTFLSIIKRYGRVFEMELIGRFNTGSVVGAGAQSTWAAIKEIARRLWKAVYYPFMDALKAPKLFLRGRLKLLPSLRGRKTAKAVFSDVRKLESERGGDAS